MSDSICPATLREQALHNAEALMAQIEVPPGAALVATGSVAREEMTEHSDLDLLLIHAPEVAIPERLWYPIWDSPLRLDSAVRTPKECEEMVSADSTAAMALLHMRLISGDENIFNQARSLVLRRWRLEVVRNFDMVVDTAIARWRRSGSIMNMTHPDIKHGRGGLRDIDLIESLALVQLCNRVDLSAERRMLTDVRTLLHHHSGRDRNILDPEFAAEIAGDLGFKDRYELASRLAQVGRTVDREVSKAMASARDLLPKGWFRPQPRKPLDVGVVDNNGQVCLAKNVDLHDPGLLLRVAVASARTKLPIASRTWAQLSKCVLPQGSWSKAMANDFFTILGSPEVIEELDRHDLFHVLVPAWSNIRGLIPREPIHTHTVDHHTLEVLRHCSQLGWDSPRPDLLYLAALFHDMGKGQQRKHAEVGAELVESMAKTLQLDPQDQTIVSTLVRHHALIPSLAQRYDPEDEAPLKQLLDACFYDPLTITLLVTLTEADARGTGTGYYQPTLAHANAVLGYRARNALTQRVPQAPEFSVPDALKIHVHPYPTGSSATVFFRGQDLLELKRLQAVLALKHWVIHHCVMRHTSDGVEAKFIVHNALGSGFAEHELALSFKAAKQLTLPPLRPGPVALHWYDQVLEIRTADQRGALGWIIEHLQGVSWLRASNPGATMIVQCAFPFDCDRALIERRIMKAFAQA